MTLITVHYCYLDDIRTPSEGRHNWKIFRTVSELKNFMECNTGAVYHLSLDHDMGDNQDTGYDFLSWLEKEIATVGVHWSIMKIDIHSANPIGSMRMHQAIQSINRLIEEKKTQEIQ